MQSDNEISTIDFAANRDAPRSLFFFHRSNLLPHNSDLISYATKGRFFCE